MDAFVTLQYENDFFSLTTGPNMLKLVSLESLLHKQTEFALLFQVGVAYFPPLEQ